MLDAGRTKAHKAGYYLCKSRRVPEPQGKQAALRSQSRTPANGPRDHLEPGKYDANICWALAADLHSLPGRSRLIRQLKTPHEDHTDSLTSNRIQKPAGILSSKFPLSSYESYRKKSHSVELKKEKREVERMFSLMFGKFISCSTGGSGEGRGACQRKRSERPDLRQGKADRCSAA